jgi:hypothetical protein
MSLESSTTVDDLVAKQSITEVIYTYCRALDRMDRELALTVWHSGGTADYGPGMYQGTGAGFVDWVWQQHALMEAHSHQISNILIDVDGDSAGSEAYVTAALRTAGEPGTQIEIVSRGRYVDQWSRRDGRWAIDHRRFVEDFTNAQPVGDLGLIERPASRSRRDRNDLSYDALG